MNFSVMQPAIDARLGWRLLIPGAPQGLARGGLGLTVMYSSALGVGLLAWDAWLTPLLVAVAVAVHFLSVCDALGHGFFPGYARGVPRLAVLLGMVFFLYLPLAVAGARLANPITIEGSSARFVVNMHAFDQTDPTSGDWVAVRGKVRRGWRVGRLVARAGQEVEVRSGACTVGGVPLDRRLGAMGAVELRLRVPDGHALIEPLVESGGGVSPAGLILVRLSDIGGRPWAQVGPISARRILF